MSSESFHHSTVASTRVLGYIPSRGQQEETTARKWANFEERQLSSRPNGPGAFDYAIFVMRKWQQLINLLALTGDTVAP
jgi:hypothetical protein